MDFPRVWLTGLLHPSTAMETLRTRPAPFWGLKAVLVRFVGTSLLVALPLALLKRTPFQPSYLGSTAKVAPVVSRHSERSEESRQRGEGTSFNTVAETLRFAQGDGVSFAPLPILCSSKMRTTT